MSAPDDKKADALADLLAYRVDAGLRAFADDFHKSMLMGPPVHAFPEKLRKGKWRFAATVEGKRVFESLTTWRTRREAAVASDHFQNGATVVYDMYAEKRDPLAGLQQTVFPTWEPISYAKKIGLNVGPNAEPR